MIVDVGDGSSSAPDLIQVGVSTGQTVTVANLAASASNLSVFQNGVDGAATAVTPGNNVAISTVGPVWLQAAAGVASAQITGGIYGAV